LKGQKNFSFVKHIHSIKVNNNIKPVTRKLLLNWRNSDMKKQEEAKVAPGMDDKEELEQDATENEIEKGEYTSVTTLPYDEVDPS
jgi:hypothetical protein